VNYKNYQLGELLNMNWKIASLAVALLCIASHASATVTGEFVVVPSEADSPAGTVTNDLLVTADTDWLAANLILHLTQGSLHQDALLVGIGPPSPALVAALPVLRWDTYVTGSQGLAGGTPSSAGGAVDLGGTSAGAFNSSAIDVNWFTTSTNDIGSFSLGRFTLSSDARGTFSLRLDGAPLRSAPFLLNGRIVNGELTLVPEPGTLAMALMGMSLIGVWARRRSVVARTAEII
jgi:hypothetical protein